MRFVKYRGGRKETREDDRMSLEWKFVKEERIDF